MLVAERFTPVASAGTVDFGMSFAAVHWLQRPVQMNSPGTLFFSDLPPESRSALAATATPWWRHPRYGGAMALAQAGPSWVEEYSA